MEVWVKLDEEEKKRLAGLAGKSMSAVVKLPEGEPFTAEGKLWVKHRRSKAVTQVSFVYEYSSNSNEFTQVQIYMDKRQIGCIKKCGADNLNFDGVLTPPAVRMGPTNISNTDELE